MQENKALVALGAAGLVGSAVGFLVAGGRAERVGAGFLSISCWPLLIHKSCLEALLLIDERFEELQHDSL